MDAQALSYRCVDAFKKEKKENTGKKKKNGLTSNRMTMGVEIEALLSATSYGYGWGFETNDAAT